MRFLPFGVDAVLIEVPDVGAAVALHAALVAAALRGVVELVPAARTVLVRFDPGTTSSAALRAALSVLPVGSGPERRGQLVELPVVYDGEDLVSVAELTGLDVAEVVRRHAAPEYDVAFTGFAPGFAYLSGGDPALVVPRRPSPRTAIPAGAVAIAGEFSGVYPRVSPGGWQLLGRTSAPLWDPARAESPALLRPGMRVRFVPVTDDSAAPVPSGRRSSPETRPSTAASRSDGGVSRAAGWGGERAVPRGALEVLGVGPLATVQDLGRRGNASLGVPPSGAMDRPALRRANRLVGNPTGAAAIEHAGGGLALRAVGPLVVAVTGAVVPMTVEREDGVDAVEPDGPIALDDGDVLVLGPPSAGVYGYVAVLGGVDVPAVLGSRSTDVLSGLGPEPLAVGAVLPGGRDHGAAVADVVEPGPDLPTDATGGAATVLDAVLGPRDDWCSPDALALLTEQEWTVTPRSNRVGVRLAGEHPLERTVLAELPSEAMVPGALQVPPDGQPVLFAADHPVTGGYPVIATVVPSSLATAVQVPAGGRVRFRIVAARGPTTPAR